MKTKLEAVLLQILALFWRYAASEEGSVFEAWREAAALVEEAKEKLIGKDSTFAKALAEQEAKADRWDRTTGDMDKLLVTVRMEPGFEADDSPMLGAANVIERLRRDLGVARAQLDDREKQLGEARAELAAMQRAAKDARNATLESQAFFGGDPHGLRGKIVDRMCAEQKATAQSNQSLADVNARDADAQALRAEIRDLTKHEEQLVAELVEMRRRGNRAIEEGNLCAQHIAQLCAELTEARKRAETAEQPSLAAIASTLCERAEQMEPHGRPDQERKQLAILAVARRLFEIISAPTMRILEAEAKIGKALPVAATMTMSPEQIEEMA